MLIFLTIFCACILLGHHRISYGVLEKYDSVNALHFPCHFLEYELVLDQFFLGYLSIY